MAQELIWPVRTICLACEEPSGGEWLCQDCHQRLERLRIGDQEGPVRSVWSYGDAAQELIHALKFDALYQVAELFAHHMAEEARRMQLPPDTVLTWVTTQRDRITLRGGDHGKALCTAVAQQLGMPARQMLVRIRSTPTQRGLSAQERLTNLRGVFACKERIDVPVLVIDDVHTTGATIRAVTDALQKAGAPAVYALTAARAEHALPQDIGMESDAGQARKGG